MEKIDENTQIIAVEKVLEEMKYAERILNSWQTCWWEEYQNVVLTQEYFDNFHWDYLKLSDEDKDENEKIDKYTRTTEYMGIPLKHLMLGEKYNCDVSTINWYDILTKNSSRNLLFHNNGNIELHKKSHKWPSKKRPTAIEYDANYNVLSNDFDISVTIDSLMDNYFEKHNYTYLTLSLKSNVLTEKFNDIEIIRYLDSGIKVIKIVKKHNKREKQNNSSVIFEAVLNPDNNLEMGSVVINTHKGNGKINGTYRFDVSKEKGVNANFYSRKGVKIDLTTNPLLLSKANTLLLSKPSNQNSSDIIVADFANSTQNTIAKNLSEKVISFDSSDFNMESIIQAEATIIENIKHLKGELPLYGLIERIDNCLYLMDMSPNKKAKGNPRTLKIDKTCIKTIPKMI